ncbi:ACT domain-containing protein [Clostridium sp. MB40-C1]|uniref:ACT domain-containing protein n=1 Tax=Clostridium sp. MB40-C1 TaxID=3070996 RepID=UPI0027E195E2|nr:ACT domain-containing protein [Clostridium sp. MB40-C1]WMJ81030.1 ACT domain-containing protein [Clostridium sp. MB40-C1]
MSKYLIINAKILPEVFYKVVQAKELLKIGQVKDITEAVKAVGISRSSYYKYKDYVFSVSEGTNVQKATIGFLLFHKAGALSKILDKIAKVNGNILTISQDIPINNAANVSITFDISNMNIDLDTLIEEIGQMKNVAKVDLIAME